MWDFFMDSAAIWGIFCGICGGNGVDGICGEGLSMVMKSMFL